MIKPVAGGEISPKGLRVRFVAMQVNSTLRRHSVENVEKNDKNRRFRVPLTGKYFLHSFVAVVRFEILARYVPKITRKNRTSPAAPYRICHFSQHSQQCSSCPVSYLQQRIANSRP